MTNGTHLESASERAPRDYRPPPGVENGTLTYYQPPPAAVERDTPTYSQPHDERPPAPVERTTPTHRQPAYPPKPPRGECKFVHFTYKPPSDERPPPTNSPGPSNIGHTPEDGSRDGRPPGFGRIMLARHQPANPLGPTNPPAESTTDIPPVLFVQKMSMIVRSKTLSYPFTNNPAISVQHV